MSKKTIPPDEPNKNMPEITANQKRWYWIRTVVLTVLIFVFVMWYTYPTRGNIAILWSAGMAGAILGYFIFSYYKLYR